MLVPEWKVKAGKGRYCSNACKYRFRVRPTGLTYNVVNENPTWFKPGERSNPAGEFKAGEVPHNFKGDQVGYDALHDWVRRHRGPPLECERCGHDGSEHRIEWANKSHEYLRDLDDWLALCVPCHHEHDRGHRTAMRDRFPGYAEQKAAAKRARRHRDREAVPA